MSLAVVLSLEDLQAKGWVLKPCPFCGGTDDLQLVDDGVHRPTVMCRCCGATVQRPTAWMAVIGWNTRPGDKVPT